MKAKNSEKSGKRGPVAGITPEFFFRKRLDQELVVPRSTPKLRTQRNQIKPKPRKNRRQEALPPQYAQFVLLLLPKRDREYLIGDLDEEYSTIVLPNYGQRKAWFWYWEQTLICIYPYLVQLAKRILGLELLLKLLGKLIS